MPFTIRPFAATAGGRTSEAYELSDSDGHVRAEVWPAHGFNCLKWQRRMDDGSWRDILYTAPDWETNPVPTRSGHPILFPFPNRIAGGKFEFEGREYQLPLNDSTKQNAIHGFTPRNPWRVVDSGATEYSAFIEGEFQLSRDLPESLALWPADFILRVKYELSHSTLTVLATVENPVSKNLPFGLGYHPYFAVPEGIDSALLGASTDELWELKDSIPTGLRVNVPESLDFSGSRPIGSVALDTLYRSPDLSKYGGFFGSLTGADGGNHLEIRASSEFRDWVLFTPSHRKAIAIEPYTCATNAANLADAGWRVLKPGEVFHSRVEYLFE